MSKAIARVQTGDRYYDLHDNGAITQVDGKPSGQWHCTGAAELNNFGRTVQRYSLEQVLNNPESIPWKWKNGKQRVHLTDLDHGTNRLWGNPGHKVYKL